MSTPLAVRAAAATACLALVLAGCSSDDGGTAAKDTAPTAVEAKAAATAINLTKADLPGYDSSPADTTKDDSEDAFTAFYDCVGVDATQTDYVLEQPSDDFNKGQIPVGVQVSSEVDVSPSTAASRKQLAAFTNEKAASCLGTTFKDLIGKEAEGQPGVTISEPQVTTNTPDSLEDTDGSFSFDISMAVKAVGLEIPLKLTVDGFLVKHSEVALLTLVAGEGTEAPDRDALVAKLLERAKKSAV